MNEEIPLYRALRKDAEQYGEEELWDRSFTENVCCARAIERAIQKSTDSGLGLNADRVQPVLDEYGIKRTLYILAHSIKAQGPDAAPSEEIRDWSRSIHTVNDGIYGRYYTAKAEMADLEDFTGWVRFAYDKLNLFTGSMCESAFSDADLNGRVLVLSTESLKESAWQPQNQLWLAEGGFGCSPHSRGRAVYATCLGDGEQVRWNREDFIGVLDERFLPDWAKTRLAELRGQKQGKSMTMNGIL